MSLIALPTTTALRVPYEGNVHMINLNLFFGVPFTNRVQRGNFLAQEENATILVDTLLRLKLSEVSTFLIS